MVTVVRNDVVLYSGTDTLEARRVFLLALLWSVDAEVIYDTGEGRRTRIKIDGRGPIEELAYAPVPELEQLATALGHEVREDDLWKVIVAWEAP